jgi:hypothetical protein
MLTPQPDQPPRLRDQIAACMDARASAGKIRDDWRDYLKFRSTHGAGGGIVAAVGNAAVTYAQAEPMTKSLPHYLASVVLVFACAWTMYGTLTKQPNLNPPKDDEDGTA